MSSAIRNQQGPRLGVCGVVGCAGTTIDNEYCPRCRAEIDALEQWNREQETRRLCRFLRRQESADRFRRVVRRVRPLLDVVNAIVVLGALAYLVRAYGAALLEWLGVQ